MHKEHPDFSVRTRYLMEQFKSFPSIFKSRSLRLLILFNIETLLEQGKRDDEIFSEIGLKTKDTKGDQSSRAMMFLDNSAGFSVKGLALTEWTKLSCLQQYSLALHFFRQVLFEETQTIELIGIHGSIAQKSARFGIAPVGVLYDYQYVQHRLSTTERRWADKHGNENPYVSDIDLLYRVLDFKEVERAKIVLAELSKRVFDEFGVLIHLQSSRDIYLADDEYIPLEVLDTTGGLIDYVVNKKDSVAGKLVLRKRQ